MAEFPPAVAGLQFHPLDHRGVRNKVPVRKEDEYPTDNPLTEREVHDRLPVSTSEVQLNVPQVMELVPAEMFPVDVRPTH